MSPARLEHTNLTVSDPDATAELLEKLFGWHVRWSGSSLGDGRTVHVGEEETYLALYSPPELTGAATDNYTTPRGLNHLGVVVDDLDETERRVVAAGLEPYHHQDYEPGRRFYFRDADGVEYEVISYG